MDYFFKAITLFFLGVIAWSLYKSSVQLRGIENKILYISSNISSQTSQQSWLVSHYMKPVRGIFPWDINKCEYCGSVEKEMDSIDLQK